MLPNYQGGPQDDWWATNAPPFPPQPPPTETWQPRTPAAAPTDLRSRIAAALAAAQSTDDPEYWFQKISADPNGAGSAWDYWAGRIAQGDGAAGVRNGTVQKFNDGGGPSSGFGAAPGPYASNPNAPQYTPMPTYVAPAWTGGDFVNPTEADLHAMPGYQSQLDAGLQARERSAAAQGTVLSGGTQKALTRYGTDYANTNYQTLRNNTLDAYKQRYSQFTDKAGMDLGARTLNANEHQNTFQNNMNSYTSGNARTLTDFLTNLTAKRNADNDLWAHLNDLNGTGAQLAGGSR